MRKEEYIEKIKYIADRMLQTRPRGEVELRPYIKPEFASKKLRRGIHIDLKRYFGDVKQGDYAYVSVNLKSQYASKAALTVNGAVSFEVNGIEYGQKQSLRSCKDGEIFHVELNEGDNLAVFKCVCESDVFALDYVCAHIYWPEYWTCDYLLWVMDSIPLKEYSGEQGFCVSELVRARENKSFKDCDIAFPEPSKPCNIINFNKLYGNESGKYALAYSCACCDGELKIKPHGKCRVFVNDKQTDNYILKKGDEIKIICERTDDKWGFEDLTENILDLPQVKQERKNALRWLLAGSFGNPDCTKVQFKEPFENEDEKKTFWRFADGKSYLRPYLDTSFFGQWFYAVMVGQNGLMYSSEYKREYYEYFYDSMSILYEYYEYMQYDAELFGDTTFLKRSVRKADLDSIGTIGMNLCELYMREKSETAKEKIMYVLEELIKSIYTNIPRMSDGCFYRVDTMWADDTYMSCPFLVRMGNITGNEEYLNEAVRQLRMYKERLYMEKKNIFSHIYFPEKKRANGVAWGRGNGWLYLSLIDVIEHLPENYEGRDELIEIYSNAVLGLCRLQSEQGLWRQVLDMSYSYLETSCTAIFSVAISRGIRAGILDKDTYLPIVKKAVDGILNNSIDESGNVTGVCRGSGCKDDPNYYAGLETIKNDDHGTGMVLWAICELVYMLD